jgi:transposase
VADATPWDQIEQLAGAVWPVFNELVYQAAQGEVLYEEDTPVRVLSMIQENTTASADQRRGLYTTGIVAQVDGHEIWLYFSGRAHAGENTGVLVQQREPDAKPLILMSDALSGLSTNSCGYLSTNSCENQTGTEYESADDGAG